MATEQISLVKAATSPFTGLYWIKTIMYMLGMCAILFIGWGVYKAYFKTPPPTQDINVQPGGVVNIKQETKVNKHMFIPFVEMSVGKEKNYDDLNYALRFGARYELW